MCRTDLPASDLVVILDVLHYVDHAAQPGDDLVTECLAKLTPRTQATVTSIAALPDGIRGYEDIKLKSIERTEHRATVLLGQLDGPTTLPLIGAERP